MAAHLTQGPKEGDEETSLEEGQAERCEWPEAFRLHVSSELILGMEGLVLFAASLELLDLGDLDVDRGLDGHVPSSDLHRPDVDRDEDRPDADDDDRDGEEPRQG